MINSALNSESIATAINLCIDTKLQSTRVCTYATVTRVDYSNCTICAQPLVADAINSGNNKKKFIKMPEIQNIPYLMITHPQVGDDCVLIHLDRGINGGRKVKDDNGDETEIIKSTGLAHQLSDCIAICGFKRKDLGKQLYKVSFVTDNATVQIPDQYVEQGQKVKKPELNNGYDYEWFINGEKWSFVGFPVTEDITLTSVGSAIYSLGVNTIAGLTDHGKTLKYIVIPNQIDTGMILYIGNKAFEGCDNLIEVIIENGITEIKEYAFYICRNLRTIIIPNSVTNIGKYVFYGCANLASITIPNSVTSIGEGAFRACTSLTSITIPFIGTTKDGTEKTHFGYIFGASSYSYNNSYVPSSLKTVVVTGGSSIAENAFTGCDNLTSITIPNSVTSIDEYAFYGCSNITDIIIPDSVTSIGTGAFRDCTKLTIYCEAAEKPDGWVTNWNFSGRPTYWYRETKPTESGNFWHYVDGEPVKW